MSVIMSCQRSGKPLVALQTFQGFDSDLEDTLQKTIEDFYGFRVVQMGERPMPSSAFVNIKLPRYRADSILKYLKEIKPDSVGLVLGLCTSDVSTTKRDAYRNVKKPESKYSDWGVFGLGYRPGPACVVSTFRIQHKSEIVFVSRLKKICVHEIGHNLGLKHCENENCVMQDAAESIRTIDKVQLDLCHDCRSEVVIK